MLGTMVPGWNTIASWRACATSAVISAQRDVQGWIVDTIRWAISAPNQRTAAHGTEREAATAAKFDLTRAPAARPQPAPGSWTEAPPSPSERLVVLARDPWSLFAYWDFSAGQRLERLRTLGPTAQDAREALRLTPLANGPAIILELPPGATRRYVRVEPPGLAWTVEFGLQTPHGEFIPWLAAEPVATPPATASPDTTVHWVTVPPQGAPIPTDRPWNGERLRASDSPSPTPLPASHVHALH